MRYLCYVREGFEQALVAELEDLKFIKNTPTIEPGLVVFDSSVNIVKNDSIFARQILFQVSKIVELTGEKAVERLIEQLTRSYRDQRFQGVMLETSDAQSVRELERYAKSLEKPFKNALEKLKLLPKGPGAKKLPVLHVTLLSGTGAILSLGMPEVSSPHKAGILRLKARKDRASRSFGKIEEAFHVFKLQFLLKQKNRVAVDLGAAPGGWTQFLVDSGFRVVAIDHAALAPELKNNPLVSHLKKNAFDFDPSEMTDDEVFLVCDLVEKPSAVVQLIEKWLKKKWFHHALFNLKLPMKDSYGAVKKSLESLEKTAKGRWSIEVKHLFHDRDEVTVFLRGY